MNDIIIIMTFGIFNFSNPFNNSGDFVVEVSVIIERTESQDFIKTLRKITNIPLAILTNSTLMNNKTVLESLFKLDIVVAKLDASNEKLFQEINQPAGNISLKEIIESIKIFKNSYSGKLNIQIMFMNNNITYAKDIANIVSKIDPYEVQINTPLRPCSIKPLTKQKLTRIEKEFKDRNLNTISVYTSTKPKISPLNHLGIPEMSVSIATCFPDRFSIQVRKVWLLAICLS